VQSHAARPAAMRAGSAGHMKLVTAIRENAAGTCIQSGRAQVGRGAASATCEHLGQTSVPGTVSPLPHSFLHSYLPQSPTTMKHSSYNE